MRVEVKTMTATETGERSDIDTADDVVDGVDAPALGSVPADEREAMVGAAHERVAVVFGRLNAAHADLVAVIGDVAGNCGRTTGSARSNTG
jgi:hypothetical protein